MKESSLFQKFKRRPFGSNSEQVNLTETITQATQEYKMMIDDLTESLNILSECLLSIGGSTKENHESGKSVIEELNKLYENDENPTPELIESFDLFYYFCQKLADIPNRIYILQVNLVRLKQNISKHSEITLSLVRCGNANKPKNDGKGL